MRRAILITLFIISTNAAAQDHPQLLGMRLLPGYQFEPIPLPLDTSGGWVRKPGGAAFYFTYGLLVPNLADEIPPERLKWKRSQEFGTRQMMVAMRDDNQLVISLIHIERQSAFANFTGRITSDVDIVDALLMMTSLPPRQPSATTQPSR